ncbi:MAG: hypothetical protein GY754_02485, partial [bacterium]|nr:hypothetical protein [bacterium]
FYAAASNAIVLKNDYELKKLLQKATHYLAIISFGAIVLFTVMGQEIADFIYFNNLRGAGNILVLLAFSIPFALFQYIPFAILPASGKQGIVTISLLVTGCMGWPITYYATNFWGIRGTAYAYIFLTVIQFVILFVLQNTYFGYLPEFKQLWKVITASLVMGSILYFARGFWPVLIVCITGAMVYMIMLVLLKEIQPSCNESG